MPLWSYSIMGSMTLQVTKPGNPVTHKKSSYNISNGVHLGTRVVLTIGRRSTS